jgi:hypothetical protein
MKTINQRVKIRILHWMVLWIIILGMISTMVVASPDYRLTFTKGTNEYIISKYNDTNWKNTVNSTLDPSNWFEGETNITDAKSKITLQGWITTTFSTYDVLTSIIMPFYFNTTEIFFLLAIMESQAYNETTINANYTSEYDMYYGIIAVWNYTTKEYNEEPSYRDEIFVLKNPLAYKTMLDDYNNLTTKLNGNFAIQMSGYSFPNMSGDEFLWQLALNGLAIAEPQTEYLTNIINGLGCENASVSGSTLSFQRYGITQYIVEISYGIKGIMSTFTIKNATQTVIFKIISKNTEWIFYIVVIVSIAIGATLIAYGIVKSRKIKKR